jgi:hypothetical protein
MGAAAVRYVVSFPLNVTPRPGQSACAMARIGRAGYGDGGVPSARLSALICPGPLSMTRWAELQARVLHISTKTPRIKARPGCSWPSGSTQACRIIYKNPERNRKPPHHQTSKRHDPTHYRDNLPRDVRSMGRLLLLPRESLLQHPQVRLASPG